MIRPGWFGLEEQNSSKPKKKRSNSQFSEMVRVLFRKSSSKLERERVCRIGFRPKTGDQTNRKSVTWSNRTGITLKSELSNKALGSNSELSPKIGRRRKANQFKKSTCLVIKGDQAKRRIYSARRTAGSLAAQHTIDRKSSPLHSRRSSQSNLIYLAFTRPSKKNKRELP